MKHYVGEIFKYRFGSHILWITKKGLVTNASTLPALITKNQRDDFKDLPNIRTKSYLNVMNDGVMKSFFPDVEVPDSSITKHIFKNLKKFKKIPAATCSVTGRSYKYGLLKILIKNLAKSLITTCKLKPGDRVALILPNIPEFIIASHGVLAANLALTFINPLYSAPDITKQFLDAEVKLIITIPLFLNLVSEIQFHLPGYKGTICIAGKNNKAQRIFGFKSLLLKGFMRRKQVLPKLIAAEDIAIMPYSSGTSGLPKGVCLTHRNLVANISQIDIPAFNAVFLPPKNGVPETVLTVLPFFHIYGFNCVMHVSLLRSCHLVMLPKFTPRDYAQAMMIYKPKHVFVVPSLLHFIANSEEITKEHLQSVEHIVIGAAPANPNVFKQVREKAGRDIFIRQGYGMTEASPVILFTPMDANRDKYASVGVLVANTQAKIVDKDTKKTNPHDKPGDLFVKGPQIMKEYLKNKTATDDILSSDGWLETGDVAFYDKEGYFFVVDRSKELIKVKGMPVSPSDLENVIMDFPGKVIEDCAVIGVSDEIAGELPKAFIVVQKGAQVTENDVLNFVNSKVPPFKHLKGGIRFIDKIPRNVNMKILRRELKNMK